VVYSAPCQLVTPRGVVPGALRLTAVHLHFVGDPPEGPNEDEAPAQLPRRPPQSRTHKRWALAAISEVHHARYLLQQSALEIFLNDRSNALLNFPGGPAARGEAGEKLAAANGRIAVFDRRRKLDLALKLQARWQRWELTNFDYLMQAPLHPSP
jgi:hypothetical protein